MKISDKFPEINFFIENPTAYEVLYYQGDRIHNEYPLEVSEAKEIFDYIDYLEYMSKKQKEVIEKSIELLNKFSFEINVNGQKQYIKLQDLPQGKEVLKLLNGVS